MANVLTYGFWDQYIEEAKAKGWRVIDNRLGTKDKPGHRNRGVWKRDRSDKTIGLHDSDNTAGNADPTNPRLTRYDAVVGRHGGKNYIMINRWASEPRGSVAARNWVAGPQIAWAGNVGGKPTAEEQQMLGSVLDYTKQKLPDYRFKGHGELYHDDHGYSSGGRHMEEGQWYKTWQKAPTIGNGTIRVTKGNHLVSPALGIVDVNPRPNSVQPPLPSRGIRGPDIPLPDKRPDITPGTVTPAEFVAQAAKPAPFTAEVINARPGEARQFPPVPPRQPDTVLNNPWAPTVTPAVPFDASGVNPAPAVTQAPQIPQPSQAAIPPPNVEPHVDPTTDGYFLPHAPPVQLPPVEVQQGGETAIPQNIPPAPGSQPAQQGPMGAQRTDRLGPPAPQLQSGPTPAVNPQQQQQQPGTPPLPEQKPIMETQNPYSAAPKRYTAPSTTAWEDTHANLTRGTGPQVAMENPLNSLANSWAPTVTGPSWWDQGKPGSVRDTFNNWGTREGTLSNSLNSLFSGWF